jgi:predicted transcriptional regulator
MTTDKLLVEIKLVHAALKTLEEGEALNIPAVEEKKAALTAKQSIRNKEIICLVCGKGGMKTLARQLSTAHGMTPWVQ